MAKNTSYHRVALTLVVTALLMSLFFAASPAPSPERRQVTDVRILGSATAAINATVVDEADRKMAGAVVEIANVTRTWPNTDSNGTVLIAGLWADDSGTSYVLWANKSGYRDSAPAVLKMMPITTTNVTLRITGGTILGVVRDDSGPINGATVSISALGYSNTTDADGKYRLSGIPAGTHDVTATAPGYDSKTEIVVMPVGGILSKDFLLKSQTGAISGYVLINVTLEPLEGANVSVKVGDSTITVVTDSNGSYVIRDLPAGKYTITVYRDGFYPNTASGVVVTRGNETRYQNITLIEKPTRLYGVVKSGTLLLVGVTISVLGTEYRNVSDYEGNYEIRNITAGTYVVNAVLSGYLPANITNVLIPRGGEVKLDIILTALPGSQLRGTIMAGDTDRVLSGVYITIVNQNGESKSTQSNIEGEFEITGLTVGNYTLHVEFSGYRPLEVNGIPIGEGVTYRNFTLEPLRESFGGFIFGFDLAHSMMILALFLTIVILAVAVYLRIRTFQAPETAPAIYDQAEEEEEKEVKKEKKEDSDGF
ncbi:MAG: carboxypeptidase regulatory-like domain-containing protein [Thermoplasmata archaeon]